jgi:hypothetical protein
LKAAKKKQKVTYIGKPIRIKAYFSTQPVNARRHGMIYFKP